MASDKPAENFIQPTIPCFDGHYDHWSMLMKNFLRSKEYWDLVEMWYIIPEENTITAVQQRKLEELKLKDLKIKNYLFQSIDRAILETILQKDTSKHIWDSMKKKYQGCGNYGHYRNECYRKLPKNKEKGEKSNFAEKKDDETLLMAFHVKEEIDSEVWYVDTGCNNHISGWTKNRTKNDFVETISNAFYVPSLKTNLLSAGQLQEKVNSTVGFSLKLPIIITLQKYAYEIYDSVRGAITMVQMSQNRFFTLKIKTVQTCLMAKKDDSSWLWHFRYSHLNFNGLRTLYQKQMVNGLPMITPPSQVCKECVISKQHHDQFPKGKAWRAQNLLELVH
ncbi:uncharacterized protein [Malus domestica]|uniref:uncharacterized protein n=1 Tax=Malus domestica TaxID=3750 RepID=UPI0039750C45